MKQSILTLLAATCVFGGGAIAQDLTCLTESERARAGLYAQLQQEAYVARLAGERVDLQRQIRELAEDRDGYISKKVEEAGGFKDSLDQKIYDAVSEQAGKAGLEYSDGPEY